jgi:hypothetical protein
MQVVPFGPSPAGQKKVSQTIFSSDKRAAFKKVAAVSGLKMIHLTPVVALDNFAITNFGQQVF